MKQITQIYKLLLFVLLLSLPAMPAFAQYSADAMSGTDGNTLTGASMTTPSGATWSVYANQSINAAYTNDSAAGVAGGIGNWVIYGPSSTGQPTSSQYDIQTEFKVLSANTDDQFGVLDYNSSPSDGYWGQFINNNGTWVVEISKGYNGSLSNVSISAPTTGIWYRMKLTRRNNASNASNQDLALYVENLSTSMYLTSAGTYTSSTAVACMTVTDSSSPYTANLKPAWWVFGSASGSAETTGIHIRNFSATYFSNSLTGGTISANATTSSSITPQVSGITGGTAPYSTVFSYSTTTNGTYSQIGTAVAGASPVANAAATGLTGSTTYYFRAVTTDSAGTPATVTVPSSSTGTPLATSAAAVSATGYSQSGSPSSPVTTGTAITITYALTGGTTLPSSLVITPSANLSGTFASGTLTYSGSAVTIPNGTTTGTITFTPSATGSLSLSATHTGGGFSGDPSALSYTISAGPFTIPVNSSAVLFSPGNWSGDTGRGGSVYRQSWTNGGWEEWVWTAGSSPSCTLQISNQTSGSSISYSLDGTLTKNVSVPTSGGIAITVAAGPHTLIVYNRQSQQASRWNLTNAYKVTGLTVDGGATAGTAPASRPWVLIVGDSITEGIQANQGNDDFLCDYSYFTGQALSAQGYDYGLSACGYEGWLRAGDSGGDVPAYYPVSGGTYSGGGRWSLLDSTHSLLDSNNHISAYGGTGQEPTAIFINLGVNEQLNGSSTSDMQASILQALVALRGAAPNALILLQVPPNLDSSLIYGAGGTTYANIVRAGFAAYQSAHPGDAKASLIDFGVAEANTLASQTDSVHPDIFGHAYLGPEVTAAIIAKLKAGASVGGGKRRMQ